MPEEKRFSVWSIVWVILLSGVVSYSMLCALNKIDQIKDEQKVNIPITEDLGEGTQMLIPGKFIYQNHKIYVLTGIELADSNGVATVSKEFLETHPSEVVMAEHRVIITQPLPPEVARYRYFGKEVLETH